MNIGFECDKNLSEYTALQCYQKALVLLGEGESDEVLQNRISALTMVGLSNKKLGQFFNAEKQLKEALSFIDKSDLDVAIYVYEENANYFETIGLYNDLIDINDLIISMCEQHMLNIDYNDYIITVTRA